MHKNTLKADIATVFSTRTASSDGALCHSFGEKQGRVQDVIGFPTVRLPSDGVGNCTPVSPLRLLVAAPFEKAPLTSGLLTAIISGQHSAKGQRVYRDGYDEWATDLTTFLAQFGVHTVVRSNIGARLDPVFQQLDHHRAACSLNVLVDITNPLNSQD